MTTPPRTPRIAPQLVTPGLVRSVLFGATSLWILCAASAADTPPPVVSSGFHFEEQSGESLYQNVCQGCHMPLGQGASGAAAYPALRANVRLAAAAYPITNVLHGRHGMPAVGMMMSDEQVAEVVNYVRTHLDNHYTDTVTAEDVKRLR